MSTTERPGEPASQRDPVPVYLDARSALANSYLLGSGLEIGPLHQPLALPAHAHARYVDRMSVADLRREYPELVDWDLTEVDIVDDGETLATVAEESQDFIVANHFLEHTENPIGTILTHLGKLKPGGVLFYAVPDKRFTFDFRRPVTPIEHMVADYERGGEISRAEHYEEWCRLVLDESGEVRSGDEQPQEEWVQSWARRIEASKYSIHMHVWTEADFLRLILAIRERSGDALDIEAAVRVGIEFIVVLRKQGEMPIPPWPAGPPPTRAHIWRARARKAVGRVRAAVARRRARP